MPSATPTPGQSRQSAHTFTHAHAVRTSTITIKRWKVIALTAIAGFDVDLGCRAFGISRGRGPHDGHRAL